MGSTISKLTSLWPQSNLCCLLIAPQTQKLEGLQDPSLGPFRLFMPHRRKLSLPVLWQVLFHLPVTLPTGVPSLLVNTSIILKSQLQLWKG